MGAIQIKHRKNQGRTFIQISATPKNPETRTLLREFRAEVSRFEKKWKAVVRARAKLKG